jgi:hypothetical protein
MTCMHPPSSHPPPIHTLVAHLLTFWPSRSTSLYPSSRSRLTSSSTLPIGLLRSRPLVNGTMQNEHLPRSASNSHHNGSSKGKRGRGAHITAPVREMRSKRRQSNRVVTTISLFPPYLYGILRKRRRCALVKYIMKWDPSMRRQNRSKP